MKELMCNGKMKTGGFWGNPAKAVLYWYSVFLVSHCADFLAHRISGSSLYHYHNGFFTSNQHIQLGS